MNYKKGDWVIYHKAKSSTNPGPRAKIINPSSKGENYSYIVDKFWIVSKISENLLTLKTKTGKLHEVDSNDVNLRKANWFQKIIYNKRFKSIQ